MGLPNRIRGLRTACIVLFNFSHLVLADTPNHSHANPKIVYVSPFSSEARIQHSASERNENSVQPLPGTASSYGTHPLPRLPNHDYSNAQVIEDPKYATAVAEEPYVHVQSPTFVDETLHIHVDVPPDSQPAYGQEAQPAYGQEAQPAYGQEAQPAYGESVPEEVVVVVDPTPDEYAKPAPDGYEEPAPTGYEEPPLDTYVAEVVSEPPPAPNRLGLLQLLPLFVITVLAVIASTIVGALLG